jgi:rhamnulokinase
MTNSQNIVAVDLGHSSGRLVLCRWDGSQGVLREIYRFPNSAHEENGHLVWDMEYLWREVLNGFRVAAAETQGQVDSIGLESWATDYVLLDRDGKQIGLAYCLRDARNLPAMERAFTMVPKRRIYEITGIQFLPFNTLYQLLAHIQEFPGEWARAAFWLNTPEYMLFRMTGVAAAEYTSATHSQMVDAITRTWSPELCTACGLDLAKFPPIVPPGTILGNLRPEIAREVGLQGAKVIAPACHDTGSAVAGIPFAHDKLAFISSGTWSLVGSVLHEPLITDTGFQFNITNEGGVGNTIRYLRNVIGLWLFQEVLREWDEQGCHLSAAQVAAECLGIPMDGPYFVADEKRFLAPGNMVARINAALAEQGFREETRPVELSGIIFRSLARRYAEVIEGLRQATGKPLERLCIVGGGVKNEALNTITGQITGLEIVKGASESAAIGNAAVQIAALENAHSLEEIQAVASRLTFPEEA